MTYKKTSDGSEEWYEYDEKGNEIHVKNSVGFERWFEYEYYPNGNLKSQTYYTSYRQNYNSVNFTPRAINK